ncbi:Peptidase inhibitor I9 [Microlunatus sagamiharensis]|uniref:Peptidase inhibitor I9 n=2 Tax=Microlunatus sagamiharensis TaxID=546874 RepID=A0A1H2LY89_9ACTN|nr:Peptidase inhibitor I9 [Microlunatus sagamiharensis]
MARWLAASLAAVAAGGLLAGPGLAPPPAQAAPVTTPAPTPTPDQTARPAGSPTGQAAVSTYVVEASSQKASRRAARAVERAGGTVTHRYTEVLDGFAAELTARQARDLDRVRGVRTVAKDREVVANPCLDCAPEALTRTYVANWGLLRLGSRTPVTLEPGRPDGPVYVADSDGEGVTAFVLDSGVDAVPELGRRLGAGRDFVSDRTGTTDTSDCTGHGTKVAEVVAGATTGVAAATRVVPLRVFGCDDRGSWSTVIAALDWAVAHRPQGPAVVNLSGSGRTFALGDRAVRATVRAGLPVVVSAGNDAGDACRRSPARVDQALTVASSTIEDRRAPTSNAGRCVDLFAAGEDVVTTSGAASGTSFAAAHVSGAVARYLENHRRATPAQVDRFLRQNATRGALSATKDAPNRLLYLPAPVAPGAPREVKASVDPTTTAVSVTWRPPARAGSAPVIAYQVCLLDVDVLTHTPGGQCIEVSASARRATLGTGSDAVVVERGSVYSVRVAAVSKAGSGLGYDQVQVPRALASKPGIGGLIDEEARGILLFVQPTEQAYDVGPVTGYRFTRSDADGSNPVSVTIDAVNTFYEFTDIERGRPYRFTAALVTAEGVGAESDPITITYPA